MSKKNLMPTLSMQGAGRVARSPAAAMPFLLRWSTLLALLVVSLLSIWSSPVMAQTQTQSNCANQSASIAAGANTTFAMGSCAQFGFVAAPVVAPHSGSLSFANLNTNITYTNFDDGSTTDSFTLTDDFGFPVVFTVSIAPSTSVMSVTPASLSNPAIGVGYSVPLASSGGTGPYTYSLAAGTLPTGLQLNSGVISGTPTATGAFQFTIQSTDSSSPTPLSKLKLYAVTVATPTITATPANNSTFNGTRTISFNQSVTGGGGTGPYTYSIDSGALPTSLNLNASTGAITGMPSAAGNFTATIKVRDSSGGNGPYLGLFTYNFVIAELPAVPIPAASSVTVNYNSSGTNVPLTIGGGTATAVAIGTNGAHGVATVSGATISYKPTTNYTGSDSFTYTASNLGGTSSPATTVTVTISPPAAVTLTPTDGSVFTATGSTSFSKTLSASGGSGSFTYSLTGGAWPPGVALDSNTGIISGVPTAAGTFSPQVTATDTSSGTNAPFKSPAQTYSIVVTAPTITVTPTTMPAMQRNVAISSQQYTASGSANNTYTFSATGLPPGVSISSSGLLSGTPSSSGSYTPRITAIDGFGFTGFNDYSISVAAGAPTVSNSSATAAYNSGSVSTTINISTSDGTPISLTPSTAAHGTVTANGVTTFTYTPTPGYNGSDTFTYTATNLSGNSGTATVSITVSAPSYTMTPSSSTLTANIGVGYSQSFNFTGGIAPYTYAITLVSGALPSGLVFDTSGASPKISGTPTGAGDVSFTVRMSSDGTTGTTPVYPSTTYTLHVAAPTLGITPASLVQPEVGVAYGNVTLATSGGTTPYTYTVSAGSLPSGLGLSGGIISGTPLVAGVGPYAFTIKSTDANNFSVTQSYSGTVGAGKPVTANSSTSVTYGSGANVITPSITGGTPISLGIVTGPSNGNLTISGLTFSYTPNAGYTGTDSFVYTATNLIGTSAQATVSITVAAPTVVITPSTNWNAVQGSAYSQTLTWSGGAAPYAIAAVTGLPAGLSATSNTTSLTIAGTPTVSGTFSVVVSATDSTRPTPVTKAQTYTLIVAQALPVAVNDSISTMANQAVTIPVTSNDTGNITSIAIGTGPTNGTLSLNGLSVLYTPTTNYFGSDSFTYTATGPGGTSGSATVALTVSALPSPTSAPQTASVLPGQAVTLHVGAAATNGPITAVNIVGAPSSGTAVVSGTDITYTAVTGFSGTVQVTYTLSNVFGTSAVITASINVGVVPVAANQSASGAAGATVVVNLMTGATGGPFTAATLGALAPSTAGTATVSNAGSSGSPSYRLTFTAAAAFSGTATISYTLSNASGPSTAASVSITIAARTNVANDAQVKALVAAHAETANRFATAQLGNFSRRLEALHGSGWARSSFGLGLAPPTAPTPWSTDDVDRVVGAPLQAGLSKVSWPLATRADSANTKLAAANGNNAADLPELPGSTGQNGAPGKQALSLWIAGTVDFGHRNASGQEDGFRFSTDGVSMGADYRIDDKFSIGVGTGYSRDRTDIGDAGSKSVGQSVVATVYGSVRPTPNTFIDGLIGVSVLNFDSTRYVTDDGSFATGQRGGNQTFVALSGGYELRNDNFLWSPYGKLDLASTSLAQYTETANGNDALTYFKQRSRVSSGTLGLRAEGQYLSRVGTWNPRVRVEYQHQFSGADEAGIAYADQSAAGPAYVIRSADSFTGNWTAGVGVKLLLANGMALIIDYSSNLNVGLGRYQSVLLGINVPMR